MPFEAVDTLALLLEQPTPREYGVPLHADDLQQSLLSVQVAIRTDGPSVWDGDLGWGEASWGEATGAIWIDITERVRSLDWDRGASDPVVPPEVGSGTVSLDNYDGLVSPWADSGPFTDLAETAPVWDETAWDEITVTDAASIFRPGTLLRWGVTSIDPADEVTERWQPFFTGVIESVSDEQEPESGADAWVNVTVIDLAGALAAFGTALGLGFAVVEDDAYALLVQLLADIAWRYGDLETDAGGFIESFVLQVPSPTENRLAVAQLIATSADAVLLARSSGRLALLSEGRHVDHAVTFTNDPS